MFAGTTFLLARDHREIDEHLWIIITETETFPETVVIVSVTTHTPEKDQACIIERGQHPRITHRSCISFAHAKVVTREFLLERKDKGSIKLQDPISPTLLEKIRNSIGDSLTLPLSIADILIEQGIIDLDA